MMRILMTFRVALKALGRNKMRTALTMLGMIIGVAAVIAMVALGTGAQTSIETQIKSAGTNMITVSAGNFNMGGVHQGSGAANTLTVEDAAALRELPGVQYLAEGVNSRGQVIAGNQNWQTRIQGTNVDLPLIRSWPEKYGTFFTTQDVTTSAKVAVLGATVATQLFGEDTDPTGQVIRVRNQPFKVIGVMGSKGTSSGGDDQDDSIAIPFTTCQKKLMGVTYLNNITISAANADDVARTKTAIEDTMRMRHKIFQGDNDDFTVRTMEEIAADADRDHPHDGHAAGRHRGRVAAGRRHRHHEHHAGVGDRTDARDRAPPRDRGAQQATCCCSSWSRRWC